MRDLNAKEDTCELGRVNELLLDWKEDLDYISLSVLLIAAAKCLKSKADQRGNKGNQ